MAEREGFRGCRDYTLSPVRGLRRVVPLKRACPTKAVSVDYGFTRIVGYGQGRFGIVA